MLFGILWNDTVEPQHSTRSSNSPNCFEVRDSSTPTCSGQWLSWQSNVPLPWIGRPQPRSFCFTPWAFRRTPITDPKTSLHVTKPGTAASSRLIRKIYEQFVVDMADLLKGIMQSCSTHQHPFPSSPPRKNESKERNLRAGIGLCSTAEDLFLLGITLRRLCKHCFLSEAGMREVRCPKHVCGIKQV